MQPAFMFWGGSQPPVSVVFVGKGEDSRPYSLYPLYIGGPEDTTLDQMVQDGLVRGDQNAVYCGRMLGGGFLMCVDVGPRAKLAAEPDLLRQAGGRAAGYLRTHPGLPGECVLVMPSWVQGGRPVENDLRLVLEGFCLRQDCISRTTAGQEAERTVPDPVVLAEPTPDLEAQALRAFQAGEQGRWVRRVGNLRADECSPTEMALLAMGRITGSLGDKVTFPYGDKPLDLEFYEGGHELLGAKARPWDSFLAVNRTAFQMVGFDTRPAGVLAVYRCGIRGARRLSVLGKGICYDTGAWALKTPVAHMAPMHQDKHGFVTSTALFIMLVQMGVPFDVVLMGNCTYNFPGILPGSVMSTRGGRKINNWNPDAEGRLVLEDGIDFLTEGENPDVIMPIATLTGAASVALGPMINLFTTDPVDPLMTSVFHSLRRSGIKGWPMPIGYHMPGGMASTEVDMLNVDTSAAKQAGQGMAALYLARAMEQAVSNYGKGRERNPVMNHWDIAALDDSTPDGWRLAGAGVDPFLAAVWAMETQATPGGILVPRSV